MPSVPHATQVPCGPGVEHIVPLSVHPPHTACWLEQPSDCVTAQHG